MMKPEAKSLDRIYNQARTDLNQTPAIKPKDEPAWSDRLRSTAHARVALAKRVGPVDAYLLGFITDASPSI
jgi:hypothetical protein